MMIKSMDGTVEIAKNRHEDLVKELLGFVDLVGDYLNDSTTSINSVREKIKYLKRVYGANNG